MKKLLTSLAAVATLASTLSADFARVEMGAGVWGQTPTGFAHVEDGDGLLNLNGDYKSNEESSQESYAWVLIKHPIPIIPNLRLEYVTITDVGTTTGSLGGVAVPDDAPTTFVFTQYDIIPYYNILDNTFWTTIDLGIDIKVIQADTSVSAIPNSTISAYTSDYIGYNSSDTVAIPFLYARTRIEVPFTGFGAEADVKFISDGTNTMYDARGKVDYTFDIFPIVQPAIEVGYRVQQITLDDGVNQVDLNYAGVYAGLMLRF